MEHRNFSSAGRLEPHPFMNVRKITTAAFSAYIKYSLHLETRLKMIRHQSFHNSNAFVQDDILSESINSIKPMVITNLLDLLHIHCSIAHSNIRSKIGAHKIACFQRKAYLVLQPIMEPQLPCKKIENRKMQQKGTASHDCCDLIPDKGGSSPTSYIWTSDLEQLNSGQIQF